MFKLLPAMNAQKQVDGIDAMANSRNITDADRAADGLDHVRVIPAQVRVGWRARPPPRSAAGPPAISTASVMPTSPPQLTSPLIARVGAEIRAGRAGGREEADHDGDHAS